MRSYKNKIEQFIEFLEPPAENDSPKFELRNVFTLFTQDKFNKFKLIMYTKTPLIGLNFSSVILFL